MRFGRSPLLGSLLATLSVCLVSGCGSSSGETPAGGANDPRYEQLTGTGTIDNVVLEAHAPVAAANGVTWWEVELRLVDDDISQTGVIATDDSVRVVVDFWGHAEGGAVRVDGRFALDVTRWLGLALERDPSDVAAIFEGSRVAMRDGAALTPVASVEDREKWLGAVLEAMRDNPEQVASGLEKASAALDGPLGTCVGTAKSAIKGALSGIGSAFSSCAKCASHTVSSGGNPDSDASWAACNTCEKGITDAKKALGLFDFLACKKALVLPPTGGGGDADDAGGTLVKPPPGVSDATCYAQSADKVKGTFRVTDGKGAVSCTDCPTGTIPFDSKLGCAPQSKPLPPDATPAEQETWSPVDESNAVVLVPQGEGKAPAARVVTSDVCVTVDVTGTGTVNSLPVQSGPQRVIYKLGRRSWGALPKNVQTSKDQWDLTSNTHSSPTKGRYAIVSTAAASKPTSTTKNTVEEAIARGGCASRPVYGLSEQILEELSRCVKPGFLVKVPSGGSLTNAADHGYLEKPAADAIAKALKARPGKSLRISSMYRTIAQQYFLYRRAACFPAVAKPGRSNHETGIAIDVSDPDNSTWRSTLQSVGFNWLGSWDRFHFDYRGAGSVDLRGEDVRAFQRLWNRNHPEDKIGEDGGWGPETEARLKKSPAGGFPIGVPDTCEAATAAATSKGSKEPYEYLTNVTTADILPGQGCETGSDASHTSVDACIESKQVCEPFWCDLADQRIAACR